MRTVVQFARGLEFGAQFVEAIDDDADEKQREDYGEGGAVLFRFFDWSDGTGAADNGSLHWAGAAILKRTNRGRDIGIAGRSALGAAASNAERKGGVGARGDERGVGAALGRRESAIVAEILEQFTAALIANFRLFGGGIDSSLTIL
jgi:hypothetical protein